MHNSRRVYKDGKSNLAFTTMKKLFWEGRQNINVLKSKTNEILIEAERKIKRWKEYLKELYAAHLNENLLEDEDIKIRW